MSDGTELGRTLGRIGILLGILFLIVVATMLGTRPLDSDDESLPSGEKGKAYILISDKKYLATDKDKDGRMDCLLPTGFSMLTGAGTYHADGHRRDCSTTGLMSTRMDDTLRGLLTRMGELKLDLEATHASCLDSDQDGDVDCVVYVHNPAIVLLAAPAATCSTPARERLNAEQRGRFSAVLAIEEEIRRIVRAKS